jgi:hypothetical protein
LEDEFQILEDHFGYATQMRKLQARP